jgi:hypothetical protein
MTTKEAADLIRRHNNWRRGANIPMENPTDLGIALKTLVDWHDKINAEHSLIAANYDRECGDGCCYESGVDVSLDGEYIGTYAELSHCIPDLFKELGINIEVIEV